MKKSDFIFPEERSWPIPDITHARRALMTVCNTKNKERKKIIEDTIFERYPELKEVSGKE